jgi:hypothetical protein
MNVIFITSYKKEGMLMIYDYNTSNLSFIKMAKQLKDKGVKNWNFMLQLYDSKLQGIDPNSPNLSLEMQGRILKEVKLNFWYYIREVIKINSTGGKNKIL